jgi:hypothetical protein
MEIEMKQPNKVGLVFAALLGGLHAAWALLVLSGYAQAFYDFILWAHMIHLQITVGPFDAIAAVTLILITAVMGYILGCVGAWVWNRVHG